MGRKGAGKTTAATPTENSWRKRQKRTKGFAKLTQSIYIGGNWSTLGHIKHSTFPTYTGSTKSDVMGPVDIEDPVDAAMIHHMARTMGANEDYCERVGSVMEKVATIPSPTHTSLR